MRVTSIGPWVLIVVTLSLFVMGCKKDSATGESGSPSDASASAGGGGDAPSGVAAEARDAAVAEVARHWTKAPDGWITARISGSPYAPDHYLRQLHDITIAGVETFDLTESDRMNGLEWSGQVSFNHSPCREAGDPGIVLEGMANTSPSRARGRWSQWVDYQPSSMRLQKIKGHWQIPQDTWMLRGTMPTPQDYVSAGVK